MPQPEPPTPGPAAPPTPADAQRAVEQRHLDAMLAVLDADTTRLAAEAATLQRDATADLREERLALVTRRRAALAAAEHGLCFGRIDAADGVALHVGRIGLSDDAGEPLLLDWRADAARPFYAATPATSLGLRRRRHLTTDGRAVVRVSDEVLTGDPTADDVVGDGPLLAAMTAGRTGRMREVVATLQSEQDAIVRSPHRGVTVVEGGPGTGKTVVALHRAAYVLAMFDQARTDGVLVLGPGPRFLDYISQVLPSLGENDVVLSTTTMLLAEALGVTDPARASDDLRRRLGDARVAGMLERAVRGHQAPGGTLTVTIAGDRITLTETEIAEARATAQATGLAHHPAREVFVELVTDALTDEVQERARVFLARMDEDMEVLAGRFDIEKAVAADLARLGFEADEGGVAGHKAALAELDPEALRESLAHDPVIDAAVEGLWPRLTAADVVAEVLGRRRRRWTDAHLPLLDEAAALLDGPGGRTFGHVVVDEAQELTPMQWRAVLRRCPGRSMTIVGDLAQAGPATGAPTWDAALGDVARRAQVHTLTVCYRTTTQVLAAAEPLLAEIAPHQPRSRAIRTGPAVRRITTPPPVANPAPLPVVEPVETTPPPVADPVPTTPAAASGGFDRLNHRVVRDFVAAEVAAGGLVGVVAADDDAAILEAALEGSGADRVVPVSQVRGLEWDAVVVVDPDGIRTARAGGERDLYVALTRPTTRLVVVSTGSTTGG
ncbi:Superfamily I DNA and RNA helicase-like protein [Xylanimonas cellulosilytica DSM 15894]|uniref:Superfamily I DNA and RNA helicase-like protein n=1 Tax=Xylanimonas cellulosilytica (strain DSM 15894 / JCM 12276 / CECT 5975 / KCTC 9989 / LMG 20990 / NBRC 107835 / XIL07) TaxID=446471 RepID=D1BT77_XYLCX|nr:ATP-binding domain-containing protein [Xylanimonas cellulosilytica]ACZ30919.1 Superfamily I DNA and RNA helicase-like protein [Xylanimonas cellulosilytica DSM 15894]